MAEERDELLDHDYDGIKEYDNPLPRWWLWLFYATIAFSLIYTPMYLFGFAPSTDEAYEQEMTQAREEFPERYVAAAQAPADSAGASEGGQAPAPTEQPVPPGPDLEGDAEAIAAGKEIYDANCAACHGAQGQGGIGPNLTDKYWLHGNTYEDHVAVISNGVPDKGMIAWKAILNPTKIRQSAAYVSSLVGTNPPDPKEPQGELYE